MPHLSKYKTTRQSDNCGACGQSKSAHSCCRDYYRQRTIERVGYEEWLPNVRVSVSETISDDILYDLIRRACIEFAKQTTMLRRNIELKLQDCVGDYYPCLGEQERIDKLRLLAINGICYEAVGDTCTWDIDGYKYWFHPPHSLEVHPMPRQSDCAKVILTVSAVPAEDSTEVDRTIHDSYFEAIEHYAIAKAMLIPLSTKEKQKTVGGDVMVWRINDFKKAVNRAKIALARHYSLEGNRW